MAVLLGFFTQIDKRRAFISLSPLFVIGQRLFTSLFMDLWSGISLASVGHGVLTWSYVIGPKYGSFGNKRWGQDCFPLKGCELAKHCQLWVSVFSAEKYERRGNVRDIKLIYVSDLMFRFHLDVFASSILEPWKALIVSYCYPTFCLLNAMFPDAKLLFYLNHKSVVSVLSATKFAPKMAFCGTFYQCP